MSAAARLRLLAGALAALAAGALASPGARGQEAVLRSPAAEYLPDAGLLGPRRREVLGGLGWAATWSGGDTELRATGTFEVVPWIAREQQSLRFSVYASTSLGGWGDERHGDYSPEVGGRVRFSLFPSGFADLYSVASGGYLYGTRDDGHAALHVSHGGGIRVFRTVYGEVALDHLFALDGAFEHEGRRSRHALGFGTLVGFDFCSFGTWCEHAALEQRRDDRTCCIYDRAQRACERIRAAAEERRRLCGAVGAALDASAHPLGPGEEPFEGFLRAIVGLLDAQLAAGPAPALERALADLRSMQAWDARFEQWRRDGRRQERRASRKGRVVQVKRIYAPYATELRRALGCGLEELGGPAAGCQEVCEDPPPSRDACHNVPPVRQDARP